MSRGPDRPTAAVVVIGDEVLTGKVADANGPFLIRRLRELGLRLRHLTVIADDRRAIGEAVRQASERYDVVFTTGGVGTTHDDITIDAVADEFGVAVVVAPELERLVRAYFGDRTTATHLRLAHVPEGATLIGDEAPPWPTIHFRNIYVLPGIPQLAHAKFEAIAPLLGHHSLYLGSLTLRAAEADISAALAEVAAAHAGADIGSYPRELDGTWKVRITVEGTDPERVGAALDAAQRALAGWVERREEPRLVGEPPVVKPPVG